MLTTDRPTSAPAPQPTSALPGPVVLSFDVEEHYRIEAAAHLTVEEAYRQHCCQRLDEVTRWLLGLLAERGVRATFFIVGQIARDNPALVRDIARGGHEVASHGWDHRSVLRCTPETFRADIRQSKDALEQVTGQPVVGYRAPTFSVVRQTAWALDVLAEEGMLYDSSIYPVRHDRYGVPDAPRSPFLARGGRHAILELPPATLRTLGVNVPMGGGGYFRLFPLFLTRWAARQMLRDVAPPVAMLYFHPWEFDPQQERLPLGRLSRFRSYVGIGRTRGRLTSLLGNYGFARAVDVARQLDRNRLRLLDLSGGAEVQVGSLERVVEETSCAIRHVNRG
jgi:polysaccharide deacetylase family protein (PEP-CTERM system associated)